MKIQILSDLHLEANPDFMPEPAPGADLLVLAGDIGSYQEGAACRTRTSAWRVFAAAAVRRLAHAGAVRARQP